MSRTPGALLITPAGEVVEIDFPADERDRLKVMYAVLRCNLVDCVRLTDQINLWIDEEYLYNHADEPNVPATLYLSRFGEVAQMIHGPVLLTGGGDEDGNTLPLSRDQLLATLSALSSSADQVAELKKRMGL